jgi:hypothetical protein
MSIFVFECINISTHYVLVFLLECSNARIHCVNAYWRNIVNVVCEYWYFSADRLISVYVFLHECRNVDMYGEHAC